MGARSRVLGARQFYLQRDPLRNCRFRTPRALGARLSFFAVRLESRAPRSPNLALKSQKLGLKSGSRSSGLSCFWFPVAVEPAKLVKKLPFSTSTNHMRGEHGGPSDLKLGENEREGKRQRKTNTPPGVLRGAKTTEKCVESRRPSIQSELANLGTSSTGNGVQGSRELSSARNGPARKPTVWQNGPTPAESQHGRHRSTQTSRNSRSS